MSNDEVMVMRRRLLVLLMLVATVPACDDDAGSPSSGSAGSEVDAFCESWNAAMTSGDDSAFDEILADAPAELAEAAQFVREAEASGDESPQAEAAVSEILDWTELNCERGQPGASRRRVAPPVDAAFDGLTFCSTIAFPASPPSEDSGMVLYGEADADDPYDGPMLGLLWNPAGDGTHVGDGDTQPVTVRGQSGVAAPITVFQQTILPELGTVIAWTEGDRAFGLYGRQWPIERASELVEIANGIEGLSGDFGIASDGLPDGYAVVFSGDPAVTSLILAPSPIYSLRFDGEDGLLDLSGLQLNEAEFEAFRFFTIGVDQREVAGRDSLVGHAWNADGPAVVTWREPDGLVVRIVGIGVPLAKAEEVAVRSRDLSDEEWASLVESEQVCEFP